MFNRVIIFLSFFLISLSVKSQPCDCSSDLNYLIKKVEENYAGYQHKVKGDEIKRYQKLITNLKAQAAQTKYEECFFILRAYTNFFKDGHLGIISAPSFNQIQKDSLKSLHPKGYYTADEIKSYLTNNKNKLDVVEGIWNTTSFTVGITKSKNKGEFIATILDTEEKDWKVGDIKFTLEKKKDNSYDIQFYNVTYFKQHFNSNIYKEILLPISNLLLVKTSPENDGSKYINSKNPSLPTLSRLNSDNLLLCLPSFMIDGKYLDSLLNAKEKEILSTKNLIIDLRGNGGGNFVYGKLLEYITDTDTLYSGKAKILSAKDNIIYHNYYVDYYTQAKQAVPQYLSDLIRRMKDNPGKILDYYPLTNFPVEKVTTYPKKVAILTDKANLSAAEAFLMYAKQSKKVIQIGTNTKGVLDYMNVFTVNLQCKKRYYSLYYPIYFNAELPEKSINNVGFKPDVISNLHGQKLVEFVIKYLK